MVRAIVRATEYVLNKGGDQDLLTMLTDSIAFMLQCNHDHNHSRRLAMKKDLHKDFAALCNVHKLCRLVITCFSDDLSKATKEITDANKLAKRVRAAGSYQTTSRVSRGSSNRAQRRYQPYNRNKTPFFEKVGFPQPKKRDLKQVTASSSSCVVSVMFSLPIQCEVAEILKNQSQFIGKQQMS